MIHKLRALTFVITMIFSFNSFGNESSFKTVQEFFAAISAVDHLKLKELVTENFQLLDEGDIWDVDKIISVIQVSEEKRLNYFNLISTQNNGEMAWVSYWNMAKFSKGDDEYQIGWLESAVLVKKHQTWRIQMLHSTRLKINQRPKNIVMNEYLSKQIY